MFIFIYIYFFIFTEKINFQKKKKLSSEITRTAFVIRFDGVYISSFSLSRSIRLHFVRLSLIKCYINIYVFFFFFLKFGVKRKMETMYFHGAFQYYNFSETIAIVLLLFLTVIYLLFLKICINRRFPCFRLQR